MNILDFVRLLDTYAPQELALAYDNVGLLIGTDREIHKVLVALDCTVDVAQEAVKIGADIVLTHHPLFFHPVQHILPDDPDTAPAWFLIRHGIGLYTAHTNLDACDGGVNDAIAEALQLSDARPFTADRIGRVGELPEAISLSDFVLRCERMFHTGVRFCGDATRMVKRIAVTGGAGGDLVDAAADAGCDVFLTGEMKHHEAIRAASRNLPCIVAGHYETERIVLEKWISGLQNAGNDVQYIVTCVEKTSLRTREEEKS